MPSPRHWDTRLHAFVGGLPASPADRWLRRLSGWADHGRLWLVVGALLGSRGSLRRGAVRAVGSMAVSSALVNAVLKRLFNRVRPDIGELHPDRLLRRAHLTPSFPSGHSASAAAFVTGLAMESPAVGAVLAPVALGVGYSRVHVGVHYPGDVVAGLAVGASVAAATQHWWRTRPPAPARVRPTSGRRGPAAPGWWPPSIAGSRRFRTHPYACAYRASGRAA